MKFKVYFLPFIFILILLSNCKSEKDNEQYETVFQVTDSLKIQSAKLLTAYDTLMRAHEQLANRLDKEGPSDSTAWNEILTQHKIDMENHRAIFRRHEAIFEESDELKDQRKDASAAELEANIIALKEDHEQIKAELDKIEREQAAITKEHDAMNEELKGS